MKMKIRNTEVRNIGRKLQKNGDRSAQREIERWKMLVTPACCSSPRTPDINHRQIEDNIKPAIYRIWVCFGEYKTHGPIKLQKWQIRAIKPPPPYLSQIEQRARIWAMTKYVGRVGEPVVGRPESNQN